MTCVRPARERPIATRRCALWARDPRATTCVSWRGTRTVRARRSVGLLGKFTVAWPDACRVSSGVPPIGELEISRICQKCQLEERAKNISELTRKLTTSRSAGSSRHSRPRGRVIASGSPPTPLPASTVSHVAARIHAFDHPVRTGPRITPDAAGLFRQQTTRCAPRMTTPSSTSATCSRRRSSSCSSRSSCSGGGPRPCTPPWWTARAPAGLTTTRSSSPTHPT